MRAPILRAARLAVVAFLTAMALAVTTFIGFLQTDFGRARVLHAALPLLQRNLNGSITIRRLDGNPLHDFALVDVLVRDAGGRPAIGVQRITVRYALWRLLRRQVWIERAQAEGAEVWLRPLADRRLNLTELLLHSSTGGGRSKWTVEVSGAVLRGSARWLPAGAPATKTTPSPLDRPITAALALEGNLSWRAGRTRARVEMLEARVEGQLAARAQARIGFHGSVILDDRWPFPVFQGARLSLRSEGKSLAQITQSTRPLRLRGPLALEMGIDGGPERVTVHAALDLGEHHRGGQLVVDGRIDNPGWDERALEHTTWRATARGSGIETATWEGAPAGVAELLIEAKGHGRIGRFELRQFRWRAPATTLSATGEATVDGKLAIDFALDVSDLSRAPFASQIKTAKTARRTLAGRIHATGHLARSEGALTVIAQADGRAIEAPGISVATAHAAANIADLGRIQRLRGYLTVDARGLRVGGRDLDRAVLDVVGDRRALSAGLFASGPGVSAALEIRAAPSAQGRALAGSIKRLYVLGEGGTPTALATGRPAAAATPIGWTLAAPSPFSLSEEGVKLGPLAVLRGQARIDARGSYSRAGALDGDLALRSVDLSALVHGFRPDLRLPAVLVDGQVRATGTTSSPTVNASVRARLARPAHEPVVVHAQARWAARQLHVTAHAENLDGGHVAARAELSLPSSAPSMRIDVRLQAGALPIALVRSFVRSSTDARAVPVVPAIAAAISSPPHPPAGSAELSSLVEEAAKGKLDLDARGGGTLAHPTVEAAAVVSWPTGPLSSLRAEVGVQGKARQTAARVRVTSRAGAGVMDSHAAVAVEPIALLRARSLDRGLAIDASVTVAAPAIERIPIRLPPAWGPRRGQLNFTARFEGSLARPTLTARLDGKDLSLGGAEHLGVAADLDYHSSQATAHFDAVLQGAPLLSMRGSAQLDLVGAALDGALLDGPIFVAATVPGWPLQHLHELRSTLPEMSGWLDARAQIAGTLRNPTLDAEVSTRGFQVARLAFARLDGSAHSASGASVVRLAAEQQSGGTLRLSANRSPAGALSGVANAHGFALDFLPSIAPVFASASGTVDGQISLSGTLPKPVIVGRASLHGGALVIRDEGQRLRNVELSARLDPGVIVIEKFRATDGEGTLVATATARLDGTRPTSLNAEIEAHQFGLTLPSAVIRLDGKIHAQGAVPPGGQGLEGRITVDKGIVEMPALVSGKHLQSIGPLADVVYVDPAAQRRSRGRAQGAAPFPLVVDLAIPGRDKLLLRGKEINADVQGSLRALLNGGSPRLEGTLEATAGWVDIVGQRFVIDHIRFLFSGESPINPGLDIRLTRQLGDTAIIVDVTGSASRPKIDFSSDPPRYAGSEIVGLLLTGDPSSQNVDERSLDQKVVGALSGAIIGRLKDEILPGLPLDVFKVELDAQGPGGLATSRIEVGKYITPRIFVSYQHQFGQPNALQIINNNQVTVEWRFAGRFELDTTYGDAGVGGADLVVRFRF